MIDLLLINPGEHASALARALAANNTSYQIVATPGELFNYPAELQVTDLNASSWSNEQKYKSAIAFNSKGQHWLDNISDQIILNNRPINDRAQYYLNNTFDVEFGKMFNVLSYRGRHALINASIYTDSKFNLIQDQSLQSFKDEVENVFEFLDRVGVLNGPSQVFIKPDSTVLIKLVPHGATVSNRKFWNIWPRILLLEIDQPKKAFLTFYGWVSNTGSAKQF